MFRLHENHTKVVRTSFAHQLLSFLFTTHKSLCAPLVRISPCTRFSNGTQYTIFPSKFAEFALCSPCAQHRDNYAGSIDWWYLNTRFNMRAELKCSTFSAIRIIGSYVWLTTAMMNGEPRTGRPTGKVMEEIAKWTQNSDMAEMLKTRKFRGLEERNRQNGRYYDDWWWWWWMMIRCRRLRLIK